MTLRRCRWSKSSALCLAGQAQPGRLNSTPASIMASPSRNAGPTTSQPRSGTGSGSSCSIGGAWVELRYLPPYSPDLNPVEQSFAKLKALLRKAQERTILGLHDRIGQNLDRFTPAECRSYLRNAGPAST